MEKEDAVSPVIATILMVAITVVLAATVYILVSHYASTSAATPMSGTLTSIGAPEVYKTPATLGPMLGGLTVSTTYAFYNFTVQITPSSILMDKLTITITGYSGSADISIASYAAGASSVTYSTGSTTYTWTGQPGALTSGGVFSVAIVGNSDLLAGATLTITSSSYSGSITTTFP
jgi:flagellin-like protein